MRASLSVLLFLLSQVAFLAHALSHRDAVDASAIETCALCVAVQGLDAAPPPRIETPVFTPLSSFIPSSETLSFVGTPRVSRRARAPPSA